MTTVEIIFLIIALAFIVMVYFIAKVAISACKTLDSLDRQIDNLDKSPNSIIKNANEISSNLDAKLKCLDPLFRSIANLGEGLEFRSAKFKDASMLKYLNERYLDDRFHEREHDSTTDTIADAIDLAAKGVKFWQKFNKGR